MKKITKLPIIETEIGLANNYGTHIEIHKDLKDYPDLYFPILKHELEHTQEAWSLKDFEHDFGSVPKLNYFKLAKFMIKRPKTLYQFIPIWYTKEKGLVIDLSTIIFIIVSILALFVTWRLIAWLTG